MPAPSPRPPEAPPQGPRGDRERPAGKREGGPQAHRVHGGILALGEAEEVELAASAHPHGLAARLMEEHCVRLCGAKVHLVLSCAT